MRQGLKIAFFADGMRIGCDSLATTAVGGSETALLQVAAALAGLGHQVAVFCNCATPGLHDGIAYHHLPADFALASRAGFEVAIASRNPDYLFLAPGARLRVLWCHDLVDDPARFSRGLRRAEMVFCLSRFHAARVSRALPEAAAKIRITSNGIDPLLIEEARADRPPAAGKFLYASRPERGLGLLLKYIWPCLLARHPHIELGVCSYTPRGIAPLPKHRAAQEATERLLERTPHVRPLGQLSKREYYAHLAGCQAVLYPCTFPEISCLVALEAQAMGIPILTSDHYALAETVVTPEFRVAGYPGSAVFVRNFIAGALALLENPERAGRLAAEARREVLARRTWRAVAEQWLDLFARHLAEG